LRDSQVLPIWEGTTNVLALDVLRALGSNDKALQTLKAQVNRCLGSVRQQALIEAARIAQSTLEHAESWWARTREKDRETLEAGARRFAMTIGRTIELALLIEHAQWSDEHQADKRATAAASLFAASGVDLLSDQSIDDARLLLSDQ
jgi:hypothetical protein